MIIEEMHFEFRRKANKVASEQNKTASDLEVDNMLNEARLELIEMLYSGENVKQYKLGFEVTQQRIDLLESIHTQDRKDPDLSNNRYVTYDLPDNYLHLTRAYAEVEGCPGITIGMSPEQTGDMNVVLTDYHRQPSLHWRRFPYQIAEGKIRAWHNGDFTPGTVHLEYLRMPDRMALGTYSSPPTPDEPNGHPIPRRNSEMSELIDKLTVDIAVQEYARSLQYADMYQLRQPAVTNVIQ